MGCSHVIVATSSPVDCDRSGYLCIRLEDEDGSVRWVCGLGEGGGKVLAAFPLKLTHPSRPQLHVALRPCEPMYQLHTSPPAACVNRPGGGTCTASASAAVSHKGPAQGGGGAWQCGWGRAAGLTQVSRCWVLHRHIIQLPLIIIVVAVVIFNHDVRSDVRSVCMYGPPGCAAQQDRWQALHRQALQSATCPMHRIRL